MDEHEKQLCEVIWQIKSSDNEEEPNPEEFRGLINVEDPQTPKKSEKKSPKNIIFSKPRQCYGRYCASTCSTKIGLCNACGSNISQRIMFVILKDKLPNAIIQHIYGYAADQMGNFIIPIPRRTNLCCLLDCIEYPFEGNLCQRHQGYFQ